MTKERQLLCSGLTLVAMGQLVRERIQRLLPLNVLYTKLLHTRASMFLARVTLRGVDPSVASWEILGF